PSRATAACIVDGAGNRERRRGERSGAAAAAGKVRAGHGSGGGGGGPRAARRAAPGFVVGARGRRATAPLQRGRLQRVRREARIELLVEGGRRGRTDSGGSGDHLVYI